MKKIIALITVAIIGASAFTGCGNGNENENASGQGSPTEPTTASGEITVVSREDGSGTRGAFIELFGVEQKDADGKKVDNTTEGANITNSTAVMMTTVAGDKAAIGYISLGSLNDTVKALKIDGVEATVENIKSGSYKIARPFNIAVTDEASDDAKDFISFIMSAEGQEVVSKSGYIPLDSTEEYSGKSSGENIVIAGSSSVTPVIEKLKEAYVAINPNASIEIQQSDSTTGMNNAIEGTCDIGMASRELKDSEKEAGLTHTVIATDGIAVIVNNDSGVSEMTSEQIMKIYIGEITDWSELA